jgi:hypothetical protein
MDVFSIYRKTFDDFLKNLDKVFQRYEKSTYSLIGKNVI